LFSTITKERLLVMTVYICCW